MNHLRKLFLASCLISIVVPNLVLAEEGIQPVEPKLGRPVDFYRDVYPILESKCLSCHNSADAESDLILESAATILKGGGSGPGLVAGKPDESLLYLVAARTEEPVMPPLPNQVRATALTSQELGILQQWITEGAKAGERKINDNIAWQPIPETYPAVYSLAVSPNERYVYAGRGNRIFTYDMVSKKEVARLTDPSLLAIQQDGKPLYGSGVAHRDFVHSLAVSPDGRMLASGGYRIVKLWERSAVQQLAKLPLPAKVRTLAHNIDGTFAAIVLEDNTIQLMDLATGTAGTKIPGGGSPVRAVTFSVDGETIAIGNEAGVVSTYQTSDGKHVADLKTSTGISALATREKDSQLITGHADNLICLWGWPELVEASPDDDAKPVEIKPIREMKGHTQPPQHIRLLPNGNEIITGANDASARVFNLDNGKQVFAQTVGGSVTAVASTADNNVFMATDSNKLARIWKRTNQKVADVAGSITTAQDLIAKTDEQAVRKAQFQLADKKQKDLEKDITAREASVKKAKEAKDKADKASAEAEKKFNEAKKKADEADAKLKEKTEDANLKKAKEAADKERDKQKEAFTKAKDAATSADRGVKLSEESVAKAKVLLEEVKKERTTAEAAQKQADADQVAAKKLADETRPIFSAMALLSDGTMLTGGADQAAQLWDPTTGQGIATITELGDVLHLDALPNSMLLTINAANEAIVWETTPRWRLIGTIGSETLDVSKSKISDRVTSLEFSPDGTQLAVAGGEPSRNGELQLWNITNGTLTREFKDAHSDTIFDIEFSRDGTQLVTGAADKFVKLFNVNDGAFVRSFEGHTDHVLGVGFKGDGSSIASCSSDKSIKIWNTETGEQRKTINNYSKQVTAVDFIGVTDNLISCGGDKGVKYHTASNGRNYRGFGGATDYVYAVYSSRDESMVVAAGEDGTIRVWNGKNAQVIATFAAPQPEAVTATK